MRGFAALAAHCMFSDVIDLARSPVSKLGVLRHGNGFCLVAIAPIAPGEVLLQIDGVVTRAPTRYSVQVGEDRHIDLPPGIDLSDQLASYQWSFLNHACDPNAAFRETVLVATRAIRAGEEVTFHYATTEFDMAEPFACRCGSRHCLGEVRGFRHLAPEVQARLRPHLAPHLLVRLAEGGSGALPKGA